MASDYELLMWFFAGAFCVALFCTFLWSICMKELGQERAHGDVIADDVRLTLKKYGRAEVSHVPMYVLSKLQADLVDYKLEVIGGRYYLIKENRNESV